VRYTPGVPRIVRIVRRAVIAASAILGVGVFAVWGWSFIDGVYVQFVHRGEQCELTIRRGRATVENELQAKRGREGRR
jgi:hypothetical protein